MFADTFREIEATVVGAGAGEALAIGSNYERRQVLAENLRRFALIFRETAVVIDEMVISFGPLQVGVISALPEPETPMKRPLPAGCEQEGGGLWVVVEIGRLITAINRLTARRVFFGKPVREMFESALELRRAADVVEDWARFLEGMLDDEDDCEVRALVGRLEAINHLAEAIFEATGVSDDEACLRLAERTYNEALAIRQVARSRI